MRVPTVVSKFCTWLTPISLAWAKAAKITVKPLQYTVETADRDNNIV